MKICRACPGRKTPETLARKGWSAKAAATEIGCTTGHLIRVINGERPQGRLLLLVVALPNSLVDEEVKP